LSWVGRRRGPSAPEQAGSDLFAGGADPVPVGVPLLATQGNVGDFFDVAADDVGFAHVVGEAVVVTVTLVDPKSRPEGSQCSPQFSFEPIKIRIVPNIGGHLIVPTFAVLAHPTVESLPEECWIDVLVSGLLLQAYPTINRINGLLVQKVAQIVFVAALKALDEAPELLGKGLDQ